MVISLEMAENSSAANDKLIKNLENQLERLVEQLTDLEECKNDLSKDEYDLMKEETVDQIKEFTETLDRMNKGDVSLNNKFSQMKKAIRTAIATAFNTTETIKMFGDQNVTELEMQLLALDQEFRLKKITIEQYEFKKVDLLTKLQNIGYCLAEQDKLFFEKRQDRLYQQMEQIVDDEPEQ